MPSGQVVKKAIDLLIGIKLSDRVQKHSACGVDYEETVLSSGNLLSKVANINNFILKYINVYVCVCICMCKLCCAQGQRDPQPGVCSMQRTGYCLLSECACVYFLLIISLSLNLRTLHTQQDIWDLPSSPKHPDKLYAHTQTHTKRKNNSHITLDPSSSLSVTKL